MSTIDYNAIPSLVPFHKSRGRVRIVRGPIGSGKTTAMIMELLRLAVEQKPDPNDGKRRTRMLIVRNTMPQLKQTCLASILNFLRPIADWRPSESTVRVHFGDVESDWILLPLDSEENVQRLLSLELTFAWVSEAREINPQLVKDTLSRCGRFPSIANGGPTRHGLIAESNSFRIDSPWYALLEEELPANWDYFVQPGARSGEADWLQYLVPDYYNDLIESNSEEWVHQYIDNEYGESLEGQPVYRNTFKRSFHVAEEELMPLQGAPIVVGMDFARWPAATLLQVDSRGRLLVFAELEQSNMGVEKFVQEHLFPLLQTERFARCMVYGVGDPSGVSRSQIGEESVFDALKRIGLPCFPATTNNIEPRIRAVEKYLTQQRDGGPALLIDPSCQVLIEGFTSKYQYKLKKDGTLGAMTPDKTKRPWADVHDALQYGCLGTASHVQTRVMNRLLSRSGQQSYAPPKIPVNAWT